LRPLGCEACADFCSASITFTAAGRPTLTIGRVTSTAFRPDDPKVWRELALGLAYAVTRMLRIKVPPLIALAIVLAGCLPEAISTPSTIYEPTVVGVIESVTELEGGGAVVELSTGDEITLGAGAPIFGPGPNVGELFLYGHDAAGHWYATLRDSEGECFALNQPALDDGGHIVFEFGLRLPKRADFDPGPARGGRFSAIQSGFCVDQGGRVVAYGQV
jgi:hypothetical protein